MENLKNFYYPKSVSEAVRILQDKALKAVPLAGGTSLIFSKDRDVHGLVDITRLGLDQIEIKEHQVRLGAGLRAEALARSTDLAQGAWDILRRAAAAIGSRPVRNAVTLGGNVIQAYPWSDLPAPLLALDASFVVVGEKRRVLEASELFAQHPRKVLERGSLLTEVRLPVMVGGASFIKFAQTSFDYALLDVATSIKLKDGVISQARVALSAVTPLATRVPEAEEALLGREAEEDVAMEAAAAARKAVRLSNDVRASKTYRSEMIEVFVRRSLRESFQMAKGGQE